MANIESGAAQGFMPHEGARVDKINKSRHAKYIFYSPFRKLLALRARLVLSP